MVILLWPLIGEPALAQGTWETTLRGRNLDGDIATFEAWYDTLLDITWLADAKLVETSGYDPDGYLTWNEAGEWIDSLNAGNYLGHSLWRFPTLVPINGIEFAYGETFDGTTDRSYNLSAPGTPYAGSTASELAHMFFNTLGNIAYYDVNGNPDQPGYGLSSAGPFLNLEETGYWTDVVYALVPNGAWKVHFEWGYQDPDPTFVTNYGTWIVHSGDIGQPPVGDVNMDGQVSVGDLMLVQAHVLGLEELDAMQRAHADVYPPGGDAAVTLSDVIVILRNGLK